ncbi:hypothetical protein [Arsenophonus nasoniae]|uniref:Uncharacterized protein n=1 Tax=Arsenophonus nasoniae TaxID=638 RepID=A0AA95GTE6_9GAMM|nr:hypothetical protein [Arsenophonus nasoniae]WGM00925.1 hypothetical protein QE210_13875 [Arsenophonus nasoniae]
MKDINGNSLNVTHNFSSEHTSLSYPIGSVLGGTILGLTCTGVPLLAPFCGAFGAIFGNFIQKQLTTYYVRKEINKTAGSYPCVVEIFSKGYTIFSKEFVFSDGDLFNFYINTSDQYGADSFVSGVCSFLIDKEIGYPILLKNNANPLSDLKVNFDIKDYKKIPDAKSSYGFDYITHTTDDKNDKVVWSLIRKGDYIPNLINNAKPSEFLQPPAINIEMYNKNNKNVEPDILNLAVPEYVPPVIPLKEPQYVSPMIPNIQSSNT